MTWIALPSLRSSPMSEDGLAKWEYVWIHDRPRGEESRSDALNTLGLAGWEAVSVAVVASRVLVLLKRRMPT